MLPGVGVGWGWEGDWPGQDSRQGVDPPGSQGSRCPEQNPPRPTMPHFLSLPGELWPFGNISPEAGSCMILMSLKL